MNLPNERINARQNFPFPKDGETVYETPPTLIWIPSDQARLYTVSVRDSDGKEIFRAETERSYAYDTRQWASGEYIWEVTADNGAARCKQSFTISDKAVFFDRPSAEEVLAAIPSERPRHLFSSEDITSILDARKSELEALRRGIVAAYENGLAEPPKFQHGGESLPYREYFGRFRDFCDRDLVALALGYSLLGDERAGREAKRRLLSFCDMNPLGPCSVMGAWGDEVGLSLARCLPAVFDMLCPLLDEKQRRYVAETVAVYAEQCLARLCSIDYPRNPADSHVGRIPAYLGEAALVLKGEGVRSDAELTEWLAYALDVYSGPFPHYGTPDGAWAESAFYATSYTKWYLPFFSAVERYSGKSLLHRPFYMRYSQFALHYCDPSYEIHPFGDGYWCGAEDVEWPGFFAQNPYRIYAERFGPESARERMRDLAAPELFKLHLLDVFLPPQPDESDNGITGEVESCAIFADGGYVAMHTDMGAEDDICILARATPFPVGSHRHADQGAFALFFGGETLISPSGYFGRGYGTRHHREWTRSTKAHNVPLIGGAGQKSDLAAVGRITEFDGDNRYCRLDLSALYSGVTKYMRLIELDEGGVTVTDEIESDEPLDVLYPLHTLSLPIYEDGCVTVTRERAFMRISPISGDLSPLEITDRYDVDLNDGVDEEFRVEMPKQYHIYYRAEAALAHCIKMRFDLVRYEKD